MVTLEGFLVGAVTVIVAEMIVVVLTVRAMKYFDNKNEEM